MSFFEPLYVKYSDKWNGTKLGPASLWGTLSDDRERMKMWAIADQFLFVAMKIGIIARTTYYEGI